MGFYKLVFVATVTIGINWLRLPLPNHTTQLKHGQIHCDKNYPYNKAYHQSQ